MVTPTGAIAYQPADVATGIVALLDMSARHSTDQPTNSLLWQSAAVRIFNHLMARARDPVTGMFYRALVTSDDPGSDALDVPAQYPSDVLLLDVQATIALALTRMQALVVANASLSQELSAFNFTNIADQLTSAMNGTLNGQTTSLWDGPETPSATSGAGYMEGYIPSTGQMLTNKPTRGNALTMAALHHIEADIGGTYTWQDQFILAVVTATYPTAPSNSSLLTVLPGQTGYLPGASQKFALAVGYDGGTAPLASSYTAKAIDGACEGMNELWYGFMH